MNTKLGIFDFPSPQEVFPGAFYTHGNFGTEEKNEEIVYEEILRDAGKYIEQFSGKTSPYFDVEKYNFSFFECNKSKYSSKVGYIRFVSDTINSLLNIPKGDSINTFLPTGRKKTDGKIGTLATQIFPDTDYMLSLNYEDFPVGFLGFNILSDGDIQILQLQASKIVDITHTFFSQKSHFLQGFDWCKVLVTFLEDYLGKKGYRGKIIIQSAENNDYREKPGNEGRFQKIYNKTAVDLGYQRNYNPFSLGREALDFSKKL